MLQLMSRKHSDIMDALSARIRRYYEVINGKWFITAYTFIDTEIADQLYTDYDFASGPQTMYAQIMDTFHRAWGLVHVDEIIMEVHLDEAKADSPLYKGQDYAIGLVYWHGVDGKRHSFEERWVCGARNLWYNRNIRPNARK